MASRRKGRILAFQALYSWDAAFNTSAGKGAEKGRVKKSPAPENPPPVSDIPGELLDFAWLEQDKRASLDESISNFSRLLIAGTIENIAVIDAMIRSHLQNWDFSRLNRVDLAILRMSTYTLMFQTDVAPSIVINEAIGISKEFGTDDSYRFINGVLDNIRRTLQEPQTAPAKERLCPRA
ncbi:MAG: transcription antitermination factor NusB [Treponema sp.]|jgi:N utilization substance protein B|nr:transcription antitermination factor NusB [Treponema sp.]